METNKKVKRTFILGSSAVSAYEDNPNISRDELLDLGDIVEVSFDTEAEMTAYVKGLNHAIGWDDITESFGSIHEYNPIPAPIDNKNVLEDFADVFHNGDYIEQVINGVHHHLFYFEETVFELFYTFGKNSFHLESFGKIDDQMLTYKIRAAAMSLNGGNIHIVYSDYYEDGKYSLSGMFFFNED